MLMPTLPSTINLSLPTCIMQNLSHHLDQLSSTHSGHGFYPTVTQHHHQHHPHQSKMPHPYQSNLTMPTQNNHWGDEMLLPKTHPYLPHFIEKCQYVIHPTALHTMEGCFPSTEQL